ncbi:ABC transporter substrate-binding protein [Glycomyces arizonensis]|uniref:ABC transporter substrate-binding protein n=1 Tax=Glycomyces arizonensis TaxID=256035 RepID=UPI0003FDA71D|nr:extracellular solute-binding protein [Glycomyces arizonensis]
MHLLNKHRGKAALAAIAAGTLALSACGGDDSGDDGTTEDGKIQLTVQMFGKLGYVEAGLEEKYEADHPNIDVVLEGDGINFNDDFLPAMEAALQAGSGAGDVMGMDEQGMAQMLANEDYWADLAEYGYDSRAEEYPAWKWDLGHTPGGKLAGFGTDVGGMGMCYRSDLFAEAGLPTNRDELATAWADWDGFKTVAQTFVDSGVDADFLDSPTQLQNMLLGQVAGQGDGQMYVDAEGNLTLDSEAVQTSVNTIVELNEMGAIGNFVSWSEEWIAAQAEGGFAVMPCPAWMLGVVEGNAGPDNAGNWDFAAAPGVSGNWGGSWLLVPAQSAHPEEAAELAAWLTAPEQQVAVFEAVGPFPSTFEGAEMVADYTNPYFNDAPVGEIIAASVADFPSLEYTELHPAVKGAVEGALNGLVDGTYTSDNIWDAIQSDSEDAVALGGM